MTLASRTVCALSLKTFAIEGRKKRIMKHYTTLVTMLKNQKGRGHSEDTCVDGKITLEWILGK